MSNSTNSDIRISYIQLWRQNDWGVYFRRNEVFTHILAADDDTRRVIHVEEIPLKVLLLRSFRLFTKEGRRRNEWQHIAKGLLPTPLHLKDKIYISAVVTLGGSHRSFLGYLNDLLIRVQLKVKLRKTVSLTVLVAYPPSMLSSVGVKSIRHDYLLVDLIDDVIARTTKDRKKIY